MTRMPNLCFFCRKRHKRKTVFDPHACAAFPDGIAQDILDDAASCSSFELRELSAAERECYDLRPELAEQH